MCFKLSELYLKFSYTDYRKKFQISVINLSQWKTLWKAIAVCAKNHLPNTNKFSNYVTRWSRIFLKKIAASQPPKKLPAWWGNKVHRRVYISQQFAPVPNQINPMNALSLYFFKIHFDVILSSTPRSPKGSLSLSPRPSQDCYTPLFSTILCDTSSSFLILLCLITRMTLQDSANHEPPNPAVSSGVLSPPPP